MTDHIAESPPEQPPTPAPPPRRRWGRRLALGAGVFAAALVGVVALLLGSEASSRWLLGHVPGLAVEGFSGRLGGQWQAEHLLWQQGDDRVEVRQPRFAWSPSCLLRLTLCIERLESDGVRMRFAPSAEPGADDGPLRLPVLKLPLSVQLGEVRVNSIELDDSTLVRDIQLSAQWTQEGLRIASLHAARDDLALDLEGLIKPDGDWPLDANATVRLPQVSGADWSLRIKVSGDLQGTLALDGDSQGYLPAHLNGTLQPLADNLPARLRITSARFKADASLPDALALEQLTVDAEGNLADGYRLNGSARLPGEQGPVALTLDGRIDAKGADIVALDLAASDTQHLGLKGSVNWEQALTADASLDWRDFPWHSLYPQAEQPPVAVRRFTGEVSYTDGRYLGHFAGNFDGPAGAFTLGSPFSGDLQQVHLPQLELVAGQGKATGSLTVGFANGVAWDTALDLSALNPAYWVAELPGTLAGPLRSKGELRDGRLNLNADIQLKGRLRGQPALLTAKADGAGEQWTLSTLDVRLGDNRIQGRGSLQQRIDARLDLDLKRLGQLWPGLQGQVSGRLDASGTPQAPQGQLALQGSGIAYEANCLQRLALDARLDNAQRATLQLKGSGLQAGDTDLGTLDVRGNGDRRRQSLTLALDGPLLKLALAGDGQYDDGNWRGRLASGEVRSGGQDWRLQQPARLQRLADGRVDFGAHCWISGPASLCGEDQRLMPEPRLRYHLKRFPLASLSPWLPKEFAWQGDLNADIRLDLPAAGPNGQIVLDASGGTLRVRDKQQWLDFPYSTLRITSTLAPRRVDSTLDFRGGRLGTLLVNSRVDPLGNDKPLSGDFSLAGLDLSVARPFLPQVETLAGKLNGSGRLSGTLLAPLVTGNVVLSDGQVSGGELPVSLENLGLTARIAGESVQLNGGWTSGRTGRGSLDGQVSWGQGLDVDLALRGTQLPITVEPYAELEASPDLKIALRGERLAVTGKVSVPKGQITVRQLPPSTVKVSDDTVIVGQQTDQGKPMAIAMDVNVDVGKDKLAFSGFGLTANLVGQMHIGDNLDTRGELSLKDGRYRAYGQRLTLRRARLMFVGPIDQPYLDVEAIREVDDVIAGIRLSGSAEQPVTTVFAEPAMSQEQALSYLVLGRPLGTSSEDNNMMAQAALALGLAGSSSTTGKLASDLGIRDFELDTTGSGDKTSVVASGKITDRLSLRYGVGVFEPANTIALRYLLSKKVYVEAASGIASSLDIFYKRDF